MNKHKVLITDLDETLYSWVNFFIPAFFAMLNKIIELTGIERDLLLQQFHKAHQELACPEVPYTTISLPCIREHYAGLSQEEIKAKLAPAFEVFDAIRKKNLKLYDGVAETLLALKHHGVTLIGFTEAAPENGPRRLAKLGVYDLFTHIYTSKRNYQCAHELLDDRVITANIRKPDPELLTQICCNEGFKTDEVVYLGDSPSKDIRMAKDANIYAVWANYEPEHPEYLEYLPLVSSRTPEEEAREIELTKAIREGGIKPDREIKEFRELLEVFDIAV